MRAVLVVAWVYLLCLYTQGSALQFDTSISNSGMIFRNMGDIDLSYDTHTMAFSINLTDFYEIPLKMKKVLDSIRRTCQNETATKVCLGFLGLLEERERNVDNSLAVLESLNKGKRSKRGLVDFVGKALNFLFGVSDSDVEQSFKSNIARLNATIEMHQAELFMLFKLQGDLFDLLNSTKTQNDRLFNQLFQKDNFQDQILMINLLLEKYEFYSKIIIALIQNKESGQIVELLEKPDVLNELKTIRNYNLTINQMLPINIDKEDCFRIFKISDIETSLFGNELVVKIRIPIIERGRFSLLEVLPIPIKIKHQTVIIKPTSEFSVINTIDQAEFTPITTAEKDNCKIGFSGKRICSVTSPTYFKNELCEENVYFANDFAKIRKTCEFQQIPNVNYFIPISQTNKFYIYAIDKIVLREQCTDGGWNNFVVEKSGILSVNGDCLVSTEHMKIRAHNDYKSNETKSVLLTSPGGMNLIENALIELFEFDSSKVVNNNESAILMYNVREEFNSWAEKVRREIKIEKTVDSHEEKSFSLPYGNSIVGVAILAMVLVSVYCFKAKMGKKLKKTAGLSQIVVNNSAK